MNLAARWIVGSELGRGFLKDGLGSASIFRSNPAFAVSLGLLSLMVSGPFLLPFHMPPIHSFWGEWWAAVLGLAAGVIGLVARRDNRWADTLPLPSLLLIPAVLLGILLGQFVLGRLVFPELGLLYAAYLLWAALLMILGRYLADAVGLARIADILAAAIVLGALAGAATAILQWLGVADRVPWIVRNPVGFVYANVGQANHHAHFSWMGIASVFYLRGRAYFSRKSLWLLVLVIGFGSVLGGSRSGFLYLLGLLAMLAWLRRNDLQEPVAKLYVDAAALLPLFIALNLFAAWAAPRIPEFWLELSSVFPSLDLFGLRPGNAALSGARLYEEVSGSSTRLAILRGAWVAFVEQPWLGQGVGNFAWASFTASAVRAGDEQFFVAEHAHNLVFHLLAESGAPATLLVILLLGFWVKKFFGQPWKLEHFWSGSILGFGVMHSMLEYPLWYSFFLGPTALLLGAADNGRALILIGRRVTIYLLLAALAGASILGSLRSDYAKLEMAYSNPLAAHPDRVRAWRISMDRLLTLQHESLLSPWVLLTFANLAEPSRQLAQDRADLCERGIHFMPSRSLVTRCVIQLGIAGRDADAQKLVQSVLRAFPAEREATVDELGAGAFVYPELVPTWQLARDKLKAARVKGLD